MYLRAPQCSSAAYFTRPSGLKLKKTPFRQMSHLQMYSKKTQGGFVEGPLLVFTLKTLIGKIIMIFFGTN